MPPLDTPLAAALIALIVALVQVMGKMIDWIFKKLGKDEHSKSFVVTLDPEVSAKITRTSEDVHNLVQTMPIVMQTIREVTLIQQQISENLTNLERRFEEHDKSDALTFSKMGGELEEIYIVAKDNQKALIGVTHDGHEMMGNLNRLEQEHREHDRRVMEAVSLQKDIASKLGR